MILYDGIKNENVYRCCNIYETECNRVCGDAKICSQAEDQKETEEK